MAQKKSSLGVQIIFSFLVAGGAGILAFFLSGSLPPFIQWFITGTVGVGGFVLGANLSPRFSGISAGDSYQQLRDQRKANNDLQEQETLKLIQNHRLQLEQWGFKIKHDGVRSYVQQIIQAYQFFAQEVQQDPQDSRPVKRYLNHYGDTTLKLVERYLELQASNQDTRTQEEQQFIDRIEVALQELQQAATTQLARLREHNLMDLDIELTLLEKTMELEGQGSTNSKSKSHGTDDSSTIKKGITQ